jgi:hypothetical protein
VAFLAGDEERSSRINLVSLPLRPIYTRTQAKVRMQVDAEKLSELVKRELAGVSDARVVEHIRGLLVSPNTLLREWDYGPPGQQYPCWINDTEVRIRQSAIANTALDRVARGVCSPLPIWRVFKAAGDGTRASLTDEGPWDETWKRIEALRSRDPIARYDCGHSISYGR